MAKSKQSKKRKAAKAPQQERQLGQFNLDEYVDKYIWLIVPLLVILYYWFSTQSTGFYQDDEIGHYRNMRGFWGDPWSIMGNQPKPGWKILMVVPGLFGFPGVVLAQSLIAALTVVATYYLGKALKLKNASIGALFLAVQPLFLQLSFRAYSEITAGLFVVLMILFYVKEQYILAAITSSYIFSIRQEFALVSLALGVLFLMKKRYIPFVLLGWTPVVLALIGWMHTGNPMWLIEDMRRIGLEVTVPHKPFWHYFETYIYMVGPFILGLFLVGYWAFLTPTSHIKENLKKEGFLFFTFTIMWAWSVISAWDVPDFGANPGHWRYLLSIAPLTAIYAAKGMNIVFNKERAQYVGVVLAAYVLIVLVFLSRETNGLTLLDEASYTNFIMSLALLAIVAAFIYLRAIPAKAFVTVIAIATVAFTLYAEEPRKLDTEASTVKQASEWYMEQPELHDRPLYGNHALFRYFADIDITDKARDHVMALETLEDAPKGAIVVWDSHYGNSQFGGDVPMEFFQENPDYELLHQIISSDQTFGILIFEKINE